METLKQTHTPLREICNASFFSNTEKNETFQEVGKNSTLSNTRTSMKHEHKVKAAHPWLAEQRNDPVTGTPFQEGDLVVFCASCKTAFLSKSWDFLGRRHCEQSETLAEVPEIPPESEKKGPENVKKRLRGKIIFEQGTREPPTQSIGWIALIALFTLGYAIFVYLDDSWEEANNLLALVFMLATLIFYIVSYLKEANQTEDDPERYSIAWSNQRALLDTEELVLYQDGLIISNWSVGFPSIEWIKVSQTDKKTRVQVQLKDGRAEELTFKLEATRKLLFALLEIDHLVKIQVHLRHIADIRTMEQLLKEYKVNMEYVDDKP